MAGLYVVALVLWLAWYRKAFLESNIGPAGLKADAAKDVEGAALDLDAARTEFDEFRGETESALLELDERVQGLEGSDDG